MENNDYKVTMVSIDQLQKWQDVIEKKQELFQYNWDRWVEKANGNIARGRVNTDKNREASKRHMKVVEGYLKSLNKLLTKLTK